MLYTVAAGVVLLVHLAFVVFVVLGGVAVLRWPRLAWIHAPAFVWAVLIEYLGWICPLTPLENWLREAGGGAGYPGGFLDHYVSIVLYPEGLTRGIQVALGTFVLLVNIAVYSRLVRVRTRHRP